MAEPAFVHEDDHEVAYLATSEAFFAWADDDEGRFEWVDGRPTAMAPPSWYHQHLVRAVDVALASRLAGTPRSVGAGLYVDTASPRTGGPRMREPDVAVTCSEIEKRPGRVPDPILIVEVLSPSTRGIDRGDKVEEYLRLPSLRHHLMLEQEAPRAVLSSRTEAGWVRTEHEGTAPINLAGLGFTRPLSERYPAAEEDERPDARAAENAGSS